jgi:hypothetical protein
MAAKLTTLIHEMAMQLHLVAESCTICGYRSRRPVRKLLDTPWYLEAVSSIPNLRIHHALVTETHITWNNSNQDYKYFLISEKYQFNTLCTKFWSENLKGRDQSEGLGVDGR